ncbi:MAG: hypothetical protein HY042_01905 [Spirochaetia bacterium]|nr:hypothetical protein [Spirochaetia bacterium]
MPLDSSARRIPIRLVDAEAKSRLRHLFQELENRLARPGLCDVLTTAVLELVENAVKANLKRVFFQKNGYRLDDPASYSEGLTAFIKSYGRIQSDEYTRALDELNLLVTVDVDHTKERLLVFVQNDSPLLPMEEQRVRHQLASAMLTDTLADFYLNYGDLSEGSGLGLAMIVILIRTLGFNPAHFRVFRNNNRTIARLEFPLTADYVPIRNRWAETAQEHHPPQPPSA